MIRSNFQALYYIHLNLRWHKNAIVLKFQDAHTHSISFSCTHACIYSHCTSKCERKKINAMNQSFELRSFCVYIVGTLVSTSLTHKPCIRHEYENFERKSSPFLSCQEKSKCTYGRGENHCKTLSSISLHWTPKRESVCVCKMTKREHKKVPSSPFWVKL